MRLSIEGMGSHTATALLMLSGLVGIAIAVVGAFGVEVPVLERADDPHAIMLGAIGFLSVALAIERAVDLRRQRNRLDSLHDEMSRSMPSIENRLIAIQAFQTNDTSHHLGDRKAVYETACQALSGEGRGRIIRHAHIQRQPVGAPPAGLPDPAIQAFIQQFQACIDASGPGSWDVRQFFVVTTLERLDVLEQRVRAHDEARRYTVKMWPTRGVFPAFSPLVVGDEEVFLGVDDPRTPHVGEALHLRGRESSAMICRYFDSLFVASHLADVPVFTVRDEEGVRDEQFDGLRRFMQKAKFG